MKSIQDNVKEFIISTEKAIEVYEQDHSFIEKLKKAVSFFFCHFLNVFLNQYLP